MKQFAVFAFAIVASFQVHAACLHGNEAKMKVLAESGCAAGLVLLNVETVCVAKSSPALSSLQVGQEYKLCLELQPDSTGRTWEAVVHSAEKAQ